MFKGLMSLFVSFFVHFQKLIRPYPGPLCPPPPFNYGPYIGNLALSSDQHMPAAATVPFSLQYTENLEFGSKIFQGTHSPLNTTVITFNS